MILLHCTKKMMAEIGLKESNLILASEPHSPLGTWCANIIYIDRKKCALFVNGATLTSFLIAGISRSELRQLPDQFAHHWRQFLSYECFPASVIETLIADCSKFAYAKAHDKSVLGSMNDIACHYKWYLLERTHSVAESIHELNRMPMGALKYEFPIEVLKKRVASLSI